ncbi:MAG: hypothetical protein MUC64_06275, partial [Rubritepida sp.]|nr:hypothetical protein [Rubritepida sp.]
MAAASVGAAMPPMIPEHGDDEADGRQHDLEQPPQQFARGHQRALLGRNGRAGLGTDHAQHDDVGREQCGQHQPRENRRGEERADGEVHDVRQEDEDQRWRDDLPERAGGA